MPAAAKALTKIMGDSAHVGTLAGANDKGNLGQGELCQFEAADMDHQRLTLDGLTMTGELVEFLPIDLLGREHGRRLVLIT